jgi:hypothetical protein
MERSSSDIARDTVKKIREAVEQGASFEEACFGIGIQDRGLRESIMKDSLKAIIADMHFSQGLPLKTLAMKLGISLSRLLNAKEGMPGESGGAGSPEDRRESQVA